MEIGNSSFDEKVPQKITTFSIWGAAFQVRTIYFVALSIIPAAALERFCQIRDLETKWDQGFLIARQLLQQFSIIHRIGTIQQLKRSRHKNCQNLDSVPNSGQYPPTPEIWNPQRPLFSLFRITFAISDLGWPTHPDCFPNFAVFYVFPNGVSRFRRV